MGDVEVAAGISSAERENLIAEEGILADGLPEIPQRGSPQASSLRSLSEESPKTLLHQYYGSTVSQKWKHYFCSCHDDGPDHIKQWTCVLVCPKTNQLFPSIQYEERTGHEDNGVYWFKTKSAAEHAAAARALAWFRYQEWCDSGNDLLLEPIGLLRPSEHCNGFDSLNDMIHVPTKLEEMIEQQLLQQHDSIH